MHPATVIALENAVYWPRIPMRARLNVQSRTVEQMRLSSARHAAAVHSATARDGV
jgi:hypothetical protein